MTEKQKRLWLDEQGKADIARGQCINQRRCCPSHIAQHGAVPGGRRQRDVHRAGLHRRRGLGLTRASRVGVAALNAAHQVHNEQICADKQTQSPFTTTSEETPE